MRVRNVDISSPAQKRMVKSPRDEMRLKATVEGRQVHYLPLAVRLSRSIQSFHGGLLSSASSNHC